MPISALLARIRRLVPKNNAQHYDEIVRSFGVGALLPAEGPVVSMLGLDGDGASAVPLKYRRHGFPKDLQGELPSTGKKNLYYKDVPPSIIEELWSRFFEALRPLYEAGKLGAVLFQFPHWVTAAPKSLAHVEHRASTLAMERARGIVHVIVDAPEGVTKRVHSVWEVTSPDLAIVRLHGRNASTWSGSASVAERFNYEYSEDELRDLAQPIMEVAGRAAYTHVMFNNCYRDVAQRNAGTMRRLVETIAS